MMNSSTGNDGTEDVERIRQNDLNEDDILDRRVLDRRASCTRFIYPFVFGAEDYLQRLDALDQSEWSSDERKLKVWERDRFPEHELLPHVRNYLNPKKQSQQDGEHGVPTARLLKLTNDALHSPAGLGAQAEWSLLWKKSAQAFRWNAISLAIFQGGVGLLVLDVETQSDQLDDWLDFIHYFRYTERPGITLEAERRISKDEVAPFFPTIVDTLEKSPERPGTVGDLIRGLLATATPKECSVQPLHEAFVPGQMMPWATLFVEGVPGEQQPILLYQVRNFFHRQQELHPTAQDVSLEHPSILPYVDNQWFLMTREGGAFVACDASETPFFRDTLPEHLRKQYFLQFLLVVHQRFFLMQLLDEVAAQWLSPKIRMLDEEADVFNALRRRLFTFKARGYFAQVMQREHHHRCYERWQEVLQVHQLYDEVSSSLSDMHDYLILQIDQQENRRMERMQWLIGLFGAVIGVPSLIFAYYGINDVYLPRWGTESGQLSNQMSAHVWATSLGFVGLAFGILFVFVMVPLLLRFARSGTWRSSYKRPQRHELKVRKWLAWLKLK